MIYLKKHIGCTGFISCVLLANISIVIADITIADEAKDKSIIEPKTNSKKPGLATSIKISPMRTNRKINDELSKKALAEKEAEVTKADVDHHKAQADKKVTIKAANKRHLVEGYKVDSSGKQSTYVYGYISGYENGDFFGYLYGNGSVPVYFYGRNTNDGSKSVFAKDKQSGNYILYDRQTNDETIINK